MVTRAPELDMGEAQRRLSEAAAEAKQLEERGEGFAANAAWERYELIRRAIVAQERVASLSRRQDTRELQ